jgi:hypothetical protein
MKPCSSALRPGSTPARVGVLPGQEPLLLRGLSLLLWGPLLLLRGLPLLLRLFVESRQPLQRTRLLKPTFLLLLSVPFTLCSALPPQTKDYTIPPWADLVVLEGPEPGPVLLVIAGVHGDEPSGPLAARQLADDPAPAKGRLVLLSAASPEALAAGQRWLPGWSDLNRAFPKAGNNGSHGAAGVAGTTRVAGTAGTAGAVGTTPVADAGQVAGTTPVAAAAGRTAAGGPAALLQESGSAYAAFDPTLRRAEELLALVASIQPTLLLDLHESGKDWTEGDAPALVLPPSAGTVLRPGPTGPAGPNGPAGSTSSTSPAGPNGPTSLVHPTSSTDLALAMLEAPNLEGFYFTGPVPAGSLIAAMDGLLGIPSLLVEIPDARGLDERIALHCAVVQAAMGVLGMGSDPEPGGLTPQLEQRHEQ